MQQDGPRASVLLRLDGVTKGYRDGVVFNPVLFGINLELGRGETISLRGASGSGKSTLIGLIAGLSRPDSGAIVFDGADVARLTSVDQALLRARRIGVVLQKGNLIPFLSALENVELAAKMAGRRDRRGFSMSLLQNLGLGGRIHHRPARLSGGEAQRAALAVALVNEPELLLADEVTGELDSDTADQLLTLLFETARDREMAVLYVTHDREIAARAERQLRLIDLGLVERAPWIRGLMDRALVDRAGS